MSHEQDHQAARRNILRWRILGALYQGRLDPMEDNHIVEMMRTRLQTTLEEVRTELIYLDQRKLVQIVKKTDSHWPVVLTWHGIDMVEYTVPCDAAIARPVSESALPLKQIHQRMARGRILHALVVSGSKPISDSVILMSISDNHISGGLAKLRLELTYMQLRGLVGIVKESGDDWMCSLTAVGTDVAQGTVPLWPGIAPRPECNGDY